MSADSDLSRLQLSCQRHLTYYRCHVLGESALQYRHFQETWLIYEQLSILYWHVIDSQSFPLEVEVFPELASKGAYSANEIYTLHDIQTIVQYANEVSPPKGFFYRYP